MPRLNQSLRGRKLAAWAVAHTGQAVVGDTGEGDRLALVGEARTVTARLEPLGEAGLGKSRLVRELKTHAAQGTPTAPLAIIEWRCSPYHQGSSLHPAIDFFGRLLRFTPEESPAARLDRLVAHLEELSGRRGDL